MNIVDSTVWFLFIPFLLTALAGLLPEQRYFRLFQQANYNGRQLHDIANADTPYRQRFTVFWIILVFAQLLIYTITMGGLYLSNLSIITTNLVSLFAVSLISILGSIIWYFICKRNQTIVPFHASPKDIRLSIATVFIFVAISGLFVMLFTCLMYGIESISHMVGFIKPHPDFNSVYMFSFFFLAYSLKLFSSTNLIRFASLLLHPLETLLEKRKINSSGHGMV